VRGACRFSSSLSSPLAALRFGLLVLISLGFWLRPLVALGQAASARPSRFEWDETQAKLRVSLNYRDLIDESIRQKLSRGLPTTIVFTATVHQVGRAEPLATTAQTCKITWHVWEEAYRVEVTRPGETVAGWTTTLQGVLRRCAEVRRLFAATREQVPINTALFLHAKLVINPVSPEILQKIRRWVSRPAATATAAPGDALFSTFAGLFLRRIGDAERELEFDTRPSVPSLALGKATQQSAKGARP